MEPSRSLLRVLTLKHPLFREEIDSMKKKRKRKNYSGIKSIAFSARRLVVLFMSPLLLSLPVDFFNNDPISIVAAFHGRCELYNNAIPSLTRAGSCCRLPKEVVSGGKRWKVLNHPLLRRSCSTTNDSHSDNNSLTQHPKLSTFMGIRSIGVDYGTVRTGVAISRGLTSRPLGILKDLQNTTDVAFQIARICEAEGAQQLVIGLPLNKDGSETKQADITRKFALTLAVICLERMGPTFTLWFWDERYTSKFAMARLQNSKTATASYRAADFSRAWIDADSACIILEDFYSSNGDGAERILVTCPETRMECLKKWEQRQEQKQAAIDLHNQQRDISVTARKDAMRRAKEREEQLSKDGITYLSSKAKAKKRRKKSSGWITL